MTPADLRAARERLGLSRLRLGYLLDIDPTTIYRYERGERPVPVLVVRAMRDLERELTAQPA